MNNFKKIKEVLGQELTNNVISIKDDFNKLDALSILCYFLVNEKIETDFEKLKDLLFYKENILISINGSKYLNRFSDFDATFDETNNLIILTAEILNGAFGQSLKYDICEVVKKDSIFHCKDEDGEVFLIEFVSVVSMI